MNLYGKYGGTVADNLDPSKKGRVKAYVPKAGFTSFTTDWALPSIAYPGEFQGPPVGSKIWVEFEAGDSNCPIWTGTFYGAPGGKSEVPMRAQGTDDGLETNKGTDSFQTGSGITKTEPVSDFGAIYPQNQILKTVNGIVIEVDDTKGKERVQIYHPKGTFIEIRSDGKVVIKVNNQQYLKVGADLLEHIVGSIFRTADSNWEEKSISRIIEAATIKLGKTASNGLLMSLFGSVKYNLHTHLCPTGGGTSGVPSLLFVPGTDDTIKVLGE